VRDEPARRVRSLRWGRARLPLARSYALSFTTLDHFDQVWVRVVDSRGGVGLGEAVALPGYGPESAEDIARTIVYLASPYLSRHVSGEVITVAGGMEGRMLWADFEIRPDEVRARLDPDL